jgi:hypothetical protein
MKLSVVPHRNHKSAGMRWGSWGNLFFVMKDDRVLIGGPEPIIEKVAITK